jgi:hypothetical protein
MLEILQIERSPLEGSVRVRVVNTSAGPVLSGIDLRAEPGMWLGPSQQKMELVYVPPVASGQWRWTIGWPRSLQRPGCVYELGCRRSMEKAGFTFPSRLRSGALISAIRRRREPF